jgi:archaellum component FlaF (FlaF/FlaG flagellin family)
MVDNTVLANSHIQMMEHAKTQVMALAGINESYIGQGGQYESAKQGSQNIAAAQNVLVPMLNRIRITRHELASITMDLVTDFYSDEKLIRITAVNGQYAFMPVNQVIALDDGTLVKFNDLSVNDIDVIVEDAPSSLSERTEQFNQLLSIQGQTGKPIPMEILLRYSSLKDKYQLAADLEQYYAVDAQLQQAQQYVQQLEQQVNQLGGQVNQVQSQLVQANVARAVDSEVNKAKQEITKEKEAIKVMM